MRAPPPPQLDDLIQGNEQLMRENEVMRSYLDHHVQVRLRVHSHA